MIDRAVNAGCGQNVAETAGRQLLSVREALVVRGEWQDVYRWLKLGSEDLVDAAEVRKEARSHYGHGLKQWQ